MRIRHTLTGAGGLLLAALLFVAVNVLSDRYLESVRLDLTEQGLYTLTDGTRQVLSELDDPVTVRLFLSRAAATGLPAIAAYAARVEALLREFERAAGGNFELRVIDPEPFSEQEDQAVAYGLEGIPLGDGGSALYFGLVLSGPTDAEEVVPFLSPDRERFLEYDLSRMLYQVTVPGKPAVGLLSALPIEGIPAMMPMGGAASRPWAVLDQVRQLFDLHTLDAEVESIPEDLAAVLVVHPGGLPERALYALDQYVLGGGPALVFVDPHPETMPGALPTTGPGERGLERLLDSWGLELEANAVVADINLAQRVRTVVGNRNAVVDYPVWMTVEGELLADDDVVTASLGQVVFGTAGVLAPKSTAGIETLPLVVTTPSAATVDPGRLGPGADPAQLLQGYVPRGQEIWLAARVRGTAATAWPEGPPAAPSTDPAGATSTPTDAGPAAPHVPTSTKAINVIVVADTDVLRDEFWVTVQRLLGAQLLVPIADNDALVLNALENLAGNEALIGLRTRGDFSRPFTSIEDVRAEAELRFRQKELELVAELTATEQRLSELQRRDEGDAAILDARQLQELERFRERKVEIRQQLRQVRRDLRRDIESIETWVKAVNIGLVPLLVGLGGLGFAVARRRGAR